MTFSTSDLYDAHGDALQVIDPLLRSYGGRARFAGEAVTIKCFEDNSKVKERLATPGRGKVLVVDGGGSLRCALFGGNLAVLAARNGWAGVVVNGAVRDADELDAQPIGVRALATHPRRSVKGLHSGQVGLPVVFAGVVFREGAWLAADRDGIVVLP